MFNRTAPRALALSLGIVAIAALAIVGVTAIPVASAPTGTTNVVPCSEFATGNAENATGGVCYLPTEYNGFPTLDTADYGTDIPRCAEDDWNSTGLPRCYTESEAAVIIIDASDTTIATLAK
jgi:hypothetical protein